MHIINIYWYYIDIIGYKPVELPVYSRNHLSQKLQREDNSS